MFPAVYLTHAILAIVAILAVCGLNNLRVPNGPDGSIPTAPTKSPMFLRVSGLAISESTNRYYLGGEVLVQSVRAEILVLRSDSSHKTGK